MLMKKILPLLISFIFVFFNSCSNDNPTNSSSPTSPPNHPPTTSEGIEFQDNTVVFTGDETSKISSVTSNTISFSSTDNVIDNLKVGDVIVAGISDKTPNGILRKITGMSKKNGSESVSFVTEIAQLAELIKSGTITFNNNLFSSNQSLNKLLYEDQYNGINLSGTFNESANLSGFLKFQNSVSVELKFIFSGKADLNLTANLTKSFNNTYEIYQQPLPAVAIWGDPPIIITPTLHIYAKLDGSINGNLTTNATDNFSTGVSLDYNGAWDFEKNANNSFKFNGVSVNVSSTIKLIIGGEVDFLVYESIGPYANLEPYTLLQANLSQNPNWIIYDGVQANVGISTGWLSSLISGETWATFDLVPQSKLAQAPSNLPGTPSSPQPNDGALNVSLPVTIKWVSNPTADHYDLIWGKISDLPTRVRDIKQASYQLGNLAPSTQFLWKIVAYNSSNDSTSGPIWSFTTANSTSNYSPTNPYPADGATNVSYNNLTFSWTCTDPNVPLTYDLYLGNNPSTPVIIPNLNEPTYTNQSLPPNTQIYWKVRVHDSKGDTLTGSLWNFTTANSSTSGPNFSTFTDPRDGRTYKTVQIGSQWWFAENLDYYTSDSRYYNNDSLTFHEYGRLYSWADAQKACPLGWHLPSHDEWDTLINYVGGQSIAGGELKESGTDHWDSPNTGATNDYGFSAYGGGAYGDGSFFNIKVIGTYWTSSNYGDPQNIYAYIVPFNNSYAYIDFLFYSKGYLCSVRPIKNN
jgi:uncharacterized protein (TIGR02145 family)